MYNTPTTTYRTTTIGIPVMAFRCLQTPNTDLSNIINQATVTRTCPENTLSSGAHNTGQYCVLFVCSTGESTAHDDGEIKGFFTSFHFTAVVAHLDVKTVILCRCFVRLTRQQVPTIFCEPTTLAM